MKNLLSFAITVLFILSSCDKEEEGNPPPKGFNATDGSAVGCIHIDFTKDDNVNSVILERRGKGVEEWQLITGTELTSFDENAGYNNTGLPPGKIFEYRIKNDWPDDAEYSEMEEGYAYDIIPVTEIQITSGNTSNSLSWNENNNGTFINDSEIYFDVYRSEDSLGTYEKISLVDEDRSYFDDFTFKPELQGKKFYYRVDVYFHFELNLPSGGNHWENTTPIAGTIVSSAPDNEENPTVNYTITDLGQAASSSPGFIHSLKTKEINSIVYLGAIKDAGANSIGKPALYQLNGSTWQEQWLTIPDVGFTRTSFAVNSSKSYMGGISDSLCVYEWNGSVWSSNLTPDNLGASDSPGWVSLEVFNNELYLAIEQAPDYNLQVLKWDGISSWDTIGGDASGIIASGSIFETQIENIGGTLYLHYLQDDILNIKHLDGASWTTDLEWTQEWLTDIQLDKNGSELYFSSNTLSINFDGGVYHVTSTSSVENLIPEDAEWFELGVFSFTIDSESSLIVSSMKVESAELHYPFINVYDGTEWKTISDDFSDGTEPTGLESIGTDIYYIYGDAASQGQWV
ncbi:MAG: hypothetical protein U9R60_13855, partial [Bacteroidota bacterium]|nr:hypothetical protein [Bacteroidota bacterium]